MSLMELRGRRYVPPRPVSYWAGEVLRVVGSRDVASLGFMDDPFDPVGNVRRTLPDAWRIFGAATVEAAAAKLPLGTCRWCFARNLASVHSLPTPYDTPAVRTLLGQPCGNCFRLSQPPPKRRKAGAAVTPPLPSAAPGHTVVVNRFGNVSLSHPRGCAPRSGGDTRCPVSVMFTRNRDVRPTAEGYYAVHVAGDRLAFQHMANGRRR